MDLVEYKQQGRQRYEELSTVIRNLLLRAIEEDGGYRLQQVQHRAKSVTSLTNRLAQCGLIDADGNTLDLETHRKDLAGCRVLFYTNRDVERFVRSGTVSSLFDIDWDRTRDHYPDPDEEDASALFQSINYVVKLKEDSRELQENEHLEGLWCEVQVQTSLNHVWAEMAHDTIYKRPELDGFGNAALETVTSRMRTIMRDHLMPAGFMFQEVATKIDRLLSGKALFDEGAIDAVVDAEDNNDRHSAAQRLKDDVLPFYDGLQEEYSNILSKLARAWQNADQTEQRPRQPPYERLRPAKSHEVTDVIAEIVVQYRYIIDPNAIYEFIRDRYLETRDSKSREQLVKIAEQLSANNMQVWKTWGPALQITLAKALKSEEDLVPIAPIVLVVCRAILSPTVSGFSSTSDTITRHLRTVVHSGELSSVRRDAIDLLSALISVSSEDPIRRRALETMFEASRPPRHPGSTDQLMAMIMRDAATVVKLARAFAGDLSYGLLNKLEAHVFSVWLQYRKFKPAADTDPALISAHDELVSVVTDFRGELEGHEDFSVFKILVGNEVVLPHQWDEAQPNFGRDRERRVQLQKELANRAALEDWGEWRRRIVQSVTSDTTDTSVIPDIQPFFDELAIQKPDLALDLLRDRSDLPDWTIQVLAKSLKTAGRNEDVTQQFSDWIDGGQYLKAVTATFILGDDCNPEIIGNAVRRATELGDVRACTNLMRAAARRFGERPDFWRDEVFFPCLDHVAKQSNRQWVYETWCWAEDGSLFASLDEEHVTELLDCMFEIPELDFHADAILAAVAKKHHALVLEWFGRRIELVKSSPDLKISPLPYSLGKLGNALQPFPETILAILRKWYDTGPKHFRWYSSHLLNLIYPELEQPLREELSRTVAGADADTLLFVSDHLVGFEGREILYPILREMVGTEAATDEVEKRVAGLLDETGMTRGEFGFAEASRTKIEKLQPWLEDGSERVKAFAERQIRGLERSIAAENRQAEQRIAARKLDFGEPLDNGDK